MKKRINLPLTKEAAAELRAGDSILLSGTLYTARDAAHKRLIALLDNDAAMRSLYTSITGKRCNCDDRQGQTK